MSTAYERDGLRYRLRGSVEGSKERRRAFLAQLDYSSLTAAALSADEATRAAEAEAKQNAAREQLELREEWQEKKLARLSPILTELLVETLELAPDSPLRAEIKWRFDAEAITRATFKRTEAGIEAQLEGRGQGTLRPLVDLDAVTIEAEPMALDGQITGAVFSARYGAVSEGFGSLEGLGKAIRHARAQAQARAESQD